MSHCPHCGKAILIVKALAGGAQSSAPPPASSADGSKCRKCGRVIYWETSKAGKPYPVDKAGDRRAFHRYGTNQGKEYGQ